MTHYQQFEDQPGYDEVEKIASKYLELYVTGQMDRLDVIYTKFISTSRQEVTIETLLPFGSLDEGVGQGLIRRHQHTV